MYHLQQVSGGLLQAGDHVWTGCLITYVTVNVYDYSLKNSRVTEESNEEGLVG